MHWQPQRPSTGRGWSGDSPSWWATRPRPRISPNRRCSGLPNGGRYRPGSDIARWLAVVGMRLAIDERRRRRRWGFLPIRETDQMWAMTTDPDLWRALADLDRRTRVALVLTVLDGYTQDEVGELLGVPRGTVASWLSRGRARLRAVLEEGD